MPTQDTTETKEKIVSQIKSQGPLLPVQIAREIGTSSLFISAYLSELISEKRLKVSRMKVGNSPLYFLPGQENLLENFSTYLKPQEKEALEKLKEKEILKDSDLEPATRVALQSIEDFAVPFENSGEKYWRYMLVSEEDALQKIPSDSPVEEEVFESSHEVEEKPAEENKVVASESSGETQSETSEEMPAENQETKFESPLKSSENSENEKQEVKTKKKTAKKTSKKSSSDKTNKFFNKVKEHLSEQSIEISDIVGIGKDELILKISENGEEKLLIAYNKNKVNEDDLIKAYKKASDYDMKYTVLSKNGALKKIENLLEAVGKMDGVKSMK